MATPPPTSPLTPPDAQTLSDVFSSRSPSPSSSRATTPSPDLQKLRQTHTTSGYRDGISASKSLHTQGGFDEGYPLGGRIGHQVGWIIGALGMLSRVRGGDAEAVRALKEADVELAFGAVFGEAWWDERGVWKWSVEGEGEGGVTLDDVVMAFPLLRRWRSRVTELLKGRGLECLLPWEEQGEEGVREEEGPTI